MDKRRMASVKVGWKRPPCWECFKRWVGRTWPYVKKDAKALLVKHMSCAPRPKRKFWGLYRYFRGKTPHKTGSSRLMIALDAAGHMGRFMVNQHTH